MRRLSANARIIYLLAAVFMILMIVFITSYVKNASKWAAYPTNRHIFINGRLTYAGSIYDSEGDILASTTTGERLYNNSAAIRWAVLHAVGDSEGYIATGIQATYKSSLAGYNIVNGAFKFGSRQKGNDITLTLKSRVCAAALEALGGSPGAVGVYNYKTGEILCMVSSPAFDPENKPQIDDSEKYKGIYINRFLSSSYTPGSVFKVVTAAAAIENIPDCLSRTYTCDGELKLDGGVITCPQAHGDMDLGTAFARSCNCTFAQLAVELGSGRLTKKANTLSFNEKLEMDKISVSRSVFNVNDANEAELGWSGVGQYNNTASPYQMMLLMGAIANGGAPVSPYLIDRIETPGGFPLYLGKTKTQARVLTEDACVKMQKIMRDAVINNYGESGFSGLTVCGKTGTAQVGSGKLPHAWFVGCTLDEDMPLAFAVIVENSGAGSDVAIPVIKKVLKELVK